MMSRSPLGDWLQRLLRNLRRTVKTVPSLRLSFRARKVRLKEFLTEIHVKAKSLSIAFRMKTHENRPFKRPHSKLLASQASR